MRHPRRPSGFTLLELLTVIGIVGIVAAIGLVSYLGYIESSEEASEMATISAVRGELLIRARGAEGTLLACDNDLVGDTSLNTPWMDVEVVPVALDPNDASAGHGAGVVIHAVVDQHGGEGVRLAHKVYDDLVASGALVREAALTDTAVAFSTLLTGAGAVVCQPPASTAAASTSGGSGGSGAGAATQPSTTSLAVTPNALGPGTAGPQAPTGATAQPSGQVGASSGPPATVTMATAPPLPASVANAQPPVPVSDPPTPSQPNALPSCPAGQEISVMFVGGVSKQVCAKTCGARQILDASGTCKDIAGPVPMCSAPCFDSYMGNCATEFVGLCSESYISDVCQKTCGMCGGGAAAQVPCSTLATIEGSTPQAPILPAWQPRFVGHVPTQYGQTITVTADDIVKNMGAVSPDGSSAIRVTNMEFAPRSGGRPPPRYHRIVRTDDGSWGVTRTSNAPEANEFEIMVTLDNGQGETVVSTWWSSAG